MRHIASSIVNKSQCGKQNWSKLVYEWAKNKFGIRTLDKSQSSQLKDIFAFWLQGVSSYLVGLIAYMQRMLQSMIKPSFIVVFQFLVYAMACR